MPPKKRTRSPELPPPPTAKTAPAPAAAQPPASPPIKWTPELARFVHGGVLTGSVYGDSVRAEVNSAFDSKKAANSATAYAIDVNDRMKPRDPLEEMLIAQMLLTHGRVLHLTALSSKATSVEQLQILSECADRASNTYKRQMQALADYRRPPARPADPTLLIAQANIAGQQVVQNHVHAAQGKENTTNEQGCGAGDQPRGVRSGASPALPPDPRGAGVPAEFRTPDRAVEALDRPQDARGQGPLPGKRPEAR